METASSKQSQDAINRMSQTAHDTIDRAAGAASAAYERVSAKGEDLMSMQEDWMESAREYVREQPLQALGIALAAGFVLSMLLRR